MERTARPPLRVLAVATVLALVGCSVVPPTSDGTLPAVQPTTTQSAATDPVATAPSPTPTQSFPPMPDTTTLLSALDKVSSKGIQSTGMVVMDPATGDVLASSGDVPMVPASTMKVLTSLTVLDTLGPDATFTTRVVQADPGSLVLVGGGDPLLTDAQSKAARKPASLETLAADTVTALAASGTTTVTLGYDATLFAGAGWNPNWKPTWEAYTARVSALAINSGLLDQWHAYPDPAKAAAEAFAARLTKAGIKVSAIAATPAPSGAATLAEVTSAPLSTVIGSTLRYSDNFAAEVLARHAALGRGEQGSFAGAGAAVTGWLQANDLWADGMAIDDGSGLSPANRVSPLALVRAISKALTNPNLAAVTKGFPVAGKDGTLKTRFDDPSEKAGREVVHAKTGTLSGVASLAGYVTTKDHALLVFALMANQSSAQTTAYNWLDRTAAVLANCGCR